MSSNVKPLIALGLTAVGTVLVANFQVSDPPLTIADSATSATGATGATGATATSRTTSQKVAITGGQSTTTTTGSTGGNGGVTVTSTTAPTSDTTSSSASSTSTSTPTATPTTTSQYADGTYPGARINEPWGTFAVQVTISAGQIADVQLVSSPRDGHSRSINSQAVPMLTDEVVSAQSANIDMLSGATWTSESYIESLQSALDDAAAAQQAAG